MKFLIILPIILIITGCSFLPMSEEEFLSTNSNIDNNNDNDNNDIENIPGELTVYYNSSVMQNNDTLYFESVNVGDSLTKEFVIKNTGEGTLKITEVILFGVIWQDWYLYDPIYEEDQKSLNPGESITLSVQFIPQSTGAKTSNYITIFSNDKKNERFDIKLYGVGI